MVGNQKTGVRQKDPKDLRTQEEKLDRALVTGLMLEVILETSTFPVDPQTLRQLVKTRLKDSLAVNLAGRVTLDRFRHLLSKVDIWFPLYYPLTTAGAPADGVPVQAAPAPAAAALPARRALREDRLRAWLQEEGRGLLPHRPHRKLNQDRLWEFLSRTQGGWFRLIDFTRHFGVDRKTAWEYLQKFLHAGLLRHNRGRSAAVRYALGTRFLLVRADALEPEVEAALAGLPPGLAGQVSGWLIATGGEAFCEEEWHGHLEPPRCRQFITRLLSGGSPGRGGPGGEQPDAADRAPVAPGITYRPCRISVATNHPTWSLKSPNPPFQRGTFKAIPCSSPL